jgi:hypothetical protein
MRRMLQAKLAEYFELLLTVVGVVVALILTLVMQLDRGQEQQALIFLVWLQGFLHWAVRRHSRLGRRMLFARLRAMLQDRVNNQLTIMLAMVEPSARELRTMDREAVERAVQAARTVAAELAHLSPESLRVWETRYGEAANEALGYGVERT